MVTRRFLTADMSCRMSKVLSKRLEVPKALMLFLLFTTDDRAFSLSTSYSPGPGTTLTLWSKRTERGNMLLRSAGRVLCLM